MTGTGYITKPVTNETQLFLPSSAIEEFSSGGIVVAPDLTRVKDGTVLYEMDTNSLRARPVAVFNGNHSMAAAVALVKQRADERFYQPSTIVDMEEISRLTNRSKAVISGKWKKEPDWPKPVLTLGGSPGYYWLDIVAFIRRHNWPLWRAEWDKPTRR